MWKPKTRTYVWTGGSYELWSVWIKGRQWRIFKFKKFQLWKQKIRVLYSWTNYRPLLQLLRQKPEGGSNVTWSTPAALKHQRGKRRKKRSSQSTDPSDRAEGDIVRIFKHWEDILRLSSNWCHFVERTTAGKCEQKMVLCFRCFVCHLIRRQDDFLVSRLAS